MGGRVVLGDQRRRLPRALPARRDRRRSSTPPPRSSPRPAARSPAGTRSATPSRSSGSPCRASSIPTGCSARAAAGPATCWCCRKPLGTGLALAGGSADDKAAAIAGMRRLNRAASEALPGLGRRGARRHRRHRLRARRARLGDGRAQRRAGRGRHRGLRAYPGALEAAERGVRTGGDPRNRDYVAGHLRLDGGRRGRGAVHRPADVGRPARGGRSRRRCSSLSDDVVARRRESRPATPAIVLR